MGAPDVLAFFDAGVVLGAACVVLLWLGSVLCRYARAGLL